jgi:hypothetical protein
MRTVNERIVQLSRGAGAWADAEQRFDFQCECGRLDGCDSRVLMTRAEYARVREQQDRFAVFPGHQTNELEYVVEEDDRYVIVDKNDEYERFVE